MTARNWAQGPINYIRNAPFQWHSLPWSKAFTFLFGEKKSLWYPVGITPDITENFNNFNFTFQKSCPVVCRGEIQLGIRCPLGTLTKNCLPVLRGYNQCWAVIWCLNNLRFSYFKILKKPKNFQFRFSEKFWGQAQSSREPQWEQVLFYFLGGGVQKFAFFNIKKRSTKSIL